MNQKPINVTHSPRETELLLSAAIIGMLAMKDEAACVILGSGTEARLFHETVRAFGLGLGEEAKATKLLLAAMPREVGMVLADLEMRRAFQDLTVVLAALTEALHGEEHPELLQGFTASLKERQQARG